MHCGNYVYGPDSQHNMQPCLQLQDFLMLTFNCVISETYQSCVRLADSPDL